MPSAWIGRGAIMNSIIAVAPELNFSGVELSPEKSLVTISWSNFKYNLPQDRMNYMRF